MTTLSPAPWLTVVVFALVLAAPVVYFGGIVDDTMITFRYADNFLGGHGLVFNVGEHVQGFTHPLWLFLLIPGLAAIGDPVYVSITYGAIFTVVFAVLVAGAVLRTSNDRRTAFLILSSLAVLLLLSQSWRFFQASGLENPLTGLIVAVIAIEVQRDNVRDVRLALYCALLGFARLDLLLLILPLALTVAAANVRTADTRRLLRLTLATTPLILWLVFARIYYGQFQPNTADAKLGIYPSIIDSASQGIDYLMDWFQYEPAAVIATALFVGMGLWFARDAKQRAFSAGLLVYAIYVVVIGGDFMRGRLFLPVFVGAATSGCLVLARWRPTIDWLRILAPATGLLILTTLLIPPAQTAFFNDKGILSGSNYYSGYSLINYIKNDKLTAPFLDVDLAENLREYAQVCGPTTIHTLYAGTIGYLAGPEVGMIETVGLTDDFIAALPRTEQEREHPWPGHPYKWLPVSYLAQRGDIAIIDGWQNAVKNLDCSFRNKPALFLDSQAKVIHNLTLPVPGDKMSSGLVLTVSPTHISAGDTIHVTATGFQPGTLLLIVLQGFITASGHADESGRFSTSVALPQGLLDGVYVVDVVDLAGRKVSTTVNLK